MTSAISFATDGFEVSIIRSESGELAATIRDGEFVALDSIPMQVAPDASEIAVVVQALSLVRADDFGIPTDPNAAAQVEARPGRMSQKGAWFRSARATDLEWIRADLEERGRASVYAAAIQTA